jgi:methyl-accepting chemotaxis protein
MVEDFQLHTRGAVDAMDAGTQRVSLGVETTNRAGEALKRIIQMADQVDSMIAQIAAASMQSAAAARQSSESVDAINQLGEESAASIPATNSIVESVKHGSKRLQEHIGKFAWKRPTPDGGQRPLASFLFGGRAAAAYGD